MFVTFNSEAWNSVTMFGDVAIEFMKMMGHSGTVPGALLADDVPAALARLKSELAKAGKDQQPDEDQDNAPQPVKLGQRSFPLIELLTAAAQKHCDVMWEQGNRMV